MATDDSNIIKGEQAINKYGLIKEPESPKIRMITALAHLGPHITAEFGDSARRNHKYLLSNHDDEIVNIAPSPTNPNEHVLHKWVDITVDDRAAKRSQSTGIQQKIIDTSIFTENKTVK